ncbi:MAG TPA: hypothetical protein DCW42_09225 [Bacteroidetes bacterium]|nr:hypothetical protein [Bacteroidota bacterium]
MTNNSIGKNNLPSVAFISIHPAPYRNATLSKIHQRNNFKLQVWTMFQEDAGHSYWDLEQEDYPTINLGRSFGIKGCYFHADIIISLIRESFDVLLVPGYSHLSTLAALVYCKIIGKPFIYSADTVPSLGDRQLKNPIRDSITNWIINNASAFWVPGKASKLFFLEKGVNPSKIFEGCYCLDSNQIISSNIDARSSRNDLRESVGIPSNSFMYLMVGNMIANRQHRRLVSSFKNVESNNKNAFLVLLGNGPERANIEAEIKKHDCSNIRLVDSVNYNHLANWYAASDAYVHSGNEPYSTALEYAAKAGLPIITTAGVGASLDYVSQNTSGYILKSGDNDIFSKTMLNLSLNPVLALMMGRNAQEAALKRDPEFAATQFEKAVTYAIECAKQ